MTIVIEVAGRDGERSIAESAVAADVELLLWLKRAVAQIQIHRNGVRLARRRRGVGGGDIDQPIAVQIGRHDAARIDSVGKLKALALAAAKSRSHCRTKSTIGRCRNCHGQIVDSVMVKVAYCQGGWRLPHRQRRLHGE